MGETSPSQIQLFRRYIPLVVNYIFVSFMAVCFTLVLVHLLETLIPGWNGAYLLVLSFLVTLESLLSSLLHREKILFSIEWLTQYLSEFILLFLGIKIYLLISSNGFSALFDAGFWHNLPNQTFFDDAFILSSIYATFIWFLASRFGEHLVKLEEDPEVIAQQKEGLIASDMAKTRKQLMTLVFSIGAFILFLTALLKVAFSEPNMLSHSAQWFTLPIIFYFIFGLAVLAQTRYAALRTHWHLSEIQIRNNFALNWAVYCLVLFVVVGLLSFLLPTSYALGFLATIQGVLVWISAAINYLFVVILSPFAWLLHWFASLFKTANPISPPPTTFTPPPITAPVTQPVSLSGWISSLIYWIAIFVVIGFALYYYLISRKGLTSFLAYLNASTWLSKVKEWLQLLFTQVGVKATQGFQQVQKLLRPFSTPIQALRNIGLVPLSTNPAQRVQQLYLMMVQSASEAGFPRQEATTPLEYSRYLHPAFPEVKNEITELTYGFMEARYSQHEVKQADAKELEDRLNIVENALKSKAHEDNQT